MAWPLLFLGDEHLRPDVEVLTHDPSVFLVMIWNDIHIIEERKRKRERERLDSEIGVTEARPSPPNAPLIRIQAEGSIDIPTIQRIQVMRGAVEMLAMVSEMMVAGAVPDLSDSQVEEFILAHI